MKMKAGPFRKNPKLVFLLMLCITFSLLSGCTNENLTLKDGKYEMSIQSGSGIAPFIRIDMVNMQFEFSYDLLSSYLNTGDIIVEDDVVTAATRDGKFSYSFEIISEDSMQFLAGRSSSTETTDGKIAVPDTTVFHLQTNSAGS